MSVLSNLNPEGPVKHYDNQQRIQKHMELMEREAQYGMKNKLTKIAELFEMDVLSEDDALKACKTVIQQHAKKSGKVRIENDD